MDVDGVLNCLSTKERHGGFIGIDPSLVAILAELIRLSNQYEDTRIVLSSSWRIGEDRTGAKIPDSYQYLQISLAEHGLSIYDDTPRLKWGVRGQSRRGREIAEWLYKHRDKGISGYVVLDDVLFHDFSKYGITDHLVQTSLDFGGGLQKEDIKRALQILNR
ncbi:MAG: hypothetical protein K5649_03800 [Lachnospiraceae bacterium]|nr:hypothetical protein [Lachnospiraceae bacterium]